MQYQTTIFSSGSPELADYLKAHPVGTKVQSPTKKTTWTVTQVNVNEEIPPHPDTGEAMTQVTLIMQ